MHGSRANWHPHLQLLVTDGPWRPVVAQVADTFLACGILEHGFARIRCDGCAHGALPLSVLEGQVRAWIARGDTS